MLEERKSGILLPVASLPGKDIGNFGEVAYRFLKEASEAGQKIWQVLPIGPTIIHDSPFYSPSAFAISPNYIDIEDLITNDNYKVLSREDVDEYYKKFDHEHPNKINYGLLWEQKMPLLLKAYEKFLTQKGNENCLYLNFIKEHSDWLDDYANFMGIKELHLNNPERETWFQWSEEFKKKVTFDKAIQEYSQIETKNLEEQDVEKWDLEGFADWNARRLDLYRKISYKANFYRFLQWISFTQWNKLKQKANEEGIHIIGDCPIYVAPDSADVWANQEVFKLDEAGNQSCYAGVPPDYFSPKYGQFWGNPIYNWYTEKNKINEKTFVWWAARVKHQLNLYDELRIDHFRGFAGYWEIPKINPKPKTKKEIR